MVADEMYYPGDPDELRRSLQRAVADTPVVSGSARVVVGPYGSYDLTLSYVMHALKAAANVQPARILLLAPPNTPTEGRALLPESAAFATPFGSLPVDSGILHQLIGSSTLFEIDEFSHLRDHSIETMLPALHYLFGPIPIIPVLVGKMAPSMLRHTARVLSTTLKRQDCITVVSANLSGFATPREADARARGVIRLLLESPGEKILHAMETLENPPRSLWPIILGHLLAEPSSRPLILDSGTFETDYDGDTGSVVFAAIAYT